MGDASTFPILTEAISVGTKKNLIEKFILFIVTGICGLLFLTLLYYCGPKRRITSTPRRIVTNVRGHQGDQQTNDTLTVSKPKNGQKGSLKPTIVKGVILAPEPKAAPKVTKTVPTATKPKQSTLLSGNRLKGKVGVAKKKAMNGPKTGKLLKAQAAIKGPKMKGNPPKSKAAPQMQKELKAKVKVKKGKAEQRGVVCPVKDQPGQIMRPALKINTGNKELISLMGSKVDSGEKIASNILYQPPSNIAETQEREKLTQASTLRVTSTDDILI